MAPMTSTHPLHTSTCVIRPAGVLAGNAPTRQRSDTCEAKPSKALTTPAVTSVNVDRRSSLVGVALPSGGASPFSRPTTGTSGPRCRSAERWVRTARRPFCDGAANDAAPHSKSRADAWSVASAHSPFPLVGVTSVASTCPGLPAHAHTAHTRNRSWVTSGPGQVEMVSAMRCISRKGGVCKENKTGRWGAGRGHSARASQRNGLGLVRCEAAFMPPTIRRLRGREFSQEPREMNTARMSAKHMDTMDDLRDAIRRFVRSGKVVAIEEIELMRLASRAYDEAQLLDYAFALLGCGIKENGVFGQRFGQLMREAESYRIGMAEREAERMEAACPVGTEQAA